MPWAQMQHPCSKTCKKGYYLDSLKRCQLCTVANCQACDATGACAVCQKVRLAEGLVWTSRRGGGSV